MLSCLAVPCSTCNITVCISASTSGIPSLICFFWSYSLFSILEISSFLLYLIHFLPVSSAFIIAMQKQYMTSLFWLHKHCPHCLGWLSLVMRSFNLVRGSGSYIHIWHCQVISCSSKLLSWKNDSLHWSHLLTCDSSAQVYQGDMHTGSRAMSILLITACLYHFIYVITSVNFRYWTLFAAEGFDCLVIRTSCVTYFYFLPRLGFEPRSFGSQILCSANWANSTSCIIIFITNIII